MTTANQMSLAIGQIVSVRFEEVTVTMRIVDVKSAYGRMRYQVEPIAGDGRQWVEATRIAQEVK